jgi:hypothetical protein
LARDAHPFDFRRRVLPLLVPLLVLLIGAGWLVYSRYTCCAPTPLSPDAAALQQFRDICVKEARHANGGGDLSMDDETEAKIGGYCGCVADGIGAKLRSGDIAALADGTQSDEATQILSATVSNCQAKNLK